MSDKRKSKAEAYSPQGRTAAARMPERLRMIAVVVIALIAALRPLMTETYASALHGISMAMDGGNQGSELTPAATAWIDLVIWLTTILVTFRLAIEKRRWRWTGLEIGAVFLLIGAIVSTVSAGDKRTAINASADWLTAVMLIMIVAQVVRTRVSANLILAAIVASGAASATKCVTFVTIEHGEMVREYEAQRDKLWTGQGIALDDPQIELFERRMLAAEAGGFLPFSNAQGSLLVLCGFASLALAQNRLPLRWQRVAPWILAAAIWSAILLTHSRGAMLTLCVAMVLWLTLRPMLRWMARHWRTSWTLFWTTACGAALAVILFGMWRDGLPTDSLRFRWNYWQVSSWIVSDHPWTGTGALNFDRAYMKHKPIEFPEEVDDPHNFVVSLFAQWGIFGFAGLALMMLGGTYVLFRGLNRIDSDEISPSSSEGNQETASPENPRAWITVIALGFLFVRGLIVASTGGPYSVELAFFDLGIYGVIWCVVFVIMSLIVTDIAGDAPPCSLPLQLSLAVGILAFLAHNTIDFSLFVPATLTPWAVMLGLLLTGSSPAQRPSRARITRWIPVAVANAGSLSLLVLVAIPVIRANGRLTRARNTPMPQATAHYLQAAHADPLDATPWTELAERGARQSDDVADALRYLKEALRRDPEQITLYRHLAQVHYHRHGLTAEPEKKLAELRQAVAAAEEAQRLYPASPDDHALLGVMTADLGIYTQDIATLRRGIYHLRIALKLDATREKWEIRRKPESWRCEIEDRINALKQQLEAFPAIPALTQPE